MFFEIPDFIAAAVVLCLASTVQSAIGFAYGLVATPLLIWIGIPLPNAIATVVVCSFVQATIGAGHLRASVPWGLTAVAMAVRVGMLFVGLLVLREITGLDPLVIRLLVGVVLCLLVVAQVVCKVRPVENMHWFWGALAFSTSGFLAGACGMGGPPLVIWALGHNWPVEKIRGFLFAAFALTLPVHILLLYLTFGMDILRTAATALLLAPAVFLGAAVGLPLGNRLPRPVLAGIVYATLLVIGLSSVLYFALRYEF